MRAQPPRLNPQIQPRAQHSGARLITNDPAVGLNIHGDHVTGARPRTSSLLVRRMKTSRSARLTRDNCLNQH
jgi:hypothetical protein